MNREDTQHVLLVMGNGFDIQCGLHTNYKDYFSKRYNLDWDNKEEIEEFRTVFQKALNKFPYYSTRNCNG
ncbi:hypothetical protein [Lactobacillus sp. PV034]|uniref:hypothetical protein n=1 Tax=Lactobacillus sp. PV034 TaxID=2594495 RepID=UPI00223E9107|nr:hypothetical protein [Lactobacillus sp. PV034]QNQ80207.1 hypothetical protein FP432_00875 [Lactobacillus sp. PV034]